MAEMMKELKDVMLCCASNDSDAYLCLVRMLIYVSSYFCMTDFVQQTLNSRYKKFDGIKAALNNRKMDTRG